MTASTQEMLWQGLKAEGLVDGDMPGAGAAAAPWFVRAMLGIAGWMGAAFLLLFVGASLHGLSDSSMALGIIGLLACAAAWLMFRRKPDSDFFVQFAFAVSLAGQGLILWAFAMAFDGHYRIVAFAMCLFEIALFAVLPNFTHRVWSSWMAGIALVIVMGQWQLYPYAAGLLSFACAWIWLNEFRMGRQTSPVRAAGYGLALTLMCVTGMVAWSGVSGVWYDGDDHPILRTQQWLGAALCGLALCWTAWRLLLREHVSLQSRVGIAILGITALIALVTLKAPGLAPAVLILVLGFAQGNRVLFGLGIAGLLGYLSYFYYSLHATLLFKSGLLAVTGAALLIAYFILHRVWTAEPMEENHHA